jgi:predicted kinase
MLLVLRGNSGSGKSTTAKLLRETAIRKGSKKKIALIEQDYLRRIVLKERESEGTDNIDLIFQTVSFALERGYIVILEGILYSERYKNMLSSLNNLSSKNHYFYFNVTLEETLRRHQSKQNAHEFGEKEMREWYKPHDTLGFKNEKVIEQGMSQRQIIDVILNDTGL